MRHIKAFLMAGGAAVLVAAIALVGSGALDAGGGSMGCGMMGLGRPHDMRGMMGARLPPGIDPALLPEPESEGAGLLRRYCTQCHDLPGPGLHTAPEWPAVLERMNARMQMMAGMGGCMMELAAPERRELKALRVYLQRHAQQPIDPAAYPDLGAPDGRTFAAVCAQCHALPDPGQHAPEQWPTVLARMKGHMAASGRAQPDAAQSRAILAFLQRHGGPRR